MIEFCHLFISVFIFISTVGTAIATVLAGPRALRTTKVDDSVSPWQQQGLSSRSQ